MTPLLALALLAAPALFNAEPPPPAVPARVALDSPRAALAAFLQEGRASRWEAAARYLELRGESARRGPELARRLTAILDRWASLDLSAVSPASEGEQGDGLPAGVDEVAEIPTDRRGTQPVRLVRRERPDGARWLFSSATVERIDDWYDRLDDRWLRDHLPDALLQMGPRGLLYWQWLSIPALALVAWLFGRVFAWLARRFARPLVDRSREALNARVLDRTRGPLTLFGAIIALRAALPSLCLSPGAYRSVAQLLRAGLVAAFFWALLRTVDLFAQILRTSAWARAHPSALGLVPFGSRSIQLVAFSLAVIAVMSELGYPVASLLAGLGIGGLAVALAAQKTVENLLGSVSIAVDQPFRVGDVVRVDGVTGTVESIGLRSTRLRTLDRTIVTFPNGKLADTRTESFGPRDRIALQCVLHLQYGSSAAQVRSALAGIEALLSAHPGLCSADPPMVRLADLGASALKLEVFASFQTTDWAEFTRIRQEMFLGMLEIVERAGAKLSLPIQVLPLAQGP